MTQFVKSMLFLLGIMVAFASSVEAQNYAVKFDGSIYHHLCDSIALQWLEDCEGAATLNGKTIEIVLGQKPSGMTVTQWQKNRLRLAARIKRSSTQLCVQQQSKGDERLVYVNTVPDDNGNGNNNGGNTDCCDRTVTNVNVTNSNPTRAILFYEAERTESTITIRTNMGAEEIAAAAPTFNKLAPCETCGDGSDNLTETDDAETQTSDDEKRFAPTFGVSVLPWAETGLASAGLRFNLNSKLSVNGGLMAGYNRIKQSTTILPNGDVSVTTGSHTFVGSMVGANYRWKKFSAFTSVSIWGLQSDDFSFCLGGLYRIKKTLDVGVALNLGKEVKGISLNFQF